MAYERINWQNEPSEATALNDVNLNKMDSAIYELDGKATTTETAITALQDGKVDKVTGKGLSQVDSVSVIASTYAGTKIGEVNVTSVDGTTQGNYLFNGVVVDDALSSSSENPLQNKVVKGALDNKVDKESGKGLSYYDVISVARETSKGSQIGSINLIYKDGNYESNPLYNGIEVDSAMSNTSENPVQNKVIYDALNNLLPSKTVSGNPIAISDASGFDAKSLTVSMNPMQDLHGYSNPWAGGAGKNKFNDTIGTHTINANTDVTIIIGNVYLEANKTYTISCKQTPSPLASITRNILLMFGGGSTTYNPAGNDTTIKPMVFTPTVSGTYNIRVWGHTLSADTTYSDFQVELGNQATTFAPYSNICPISGRDSVVLGVNGINQWDEEWEHKKGYSTGQMLNSDSNLASKNFIKVFPSASYYLVIPSTFDGFLYQYDSEQTFILAQRLKTGGIYSVGNNTHYIKFASNNDAFTDGYGNNISINYPSIATTYEPYNGQTHTATFPSTVYGGEHEFVDGVLKNGWSDKVDLGTLNWNYNSNYSVFTAYIPPAKKNAACACDSYAYSGTSVGASRPDKTINVGLMYFSSSFNVVSVKDTSYTSAADFKAAMNGVELVYELATPTTIETSAEEITLLKGNNVLSTNADDIELKYSVSLDSLLPTTTRTLAKSVAPIEEEPIVEEPKEETDETEEQR